MSVQKTASLGSGSSSDGNQGLLTLESLRRLYQFVHKEKGNFENDTKRTATRDEHWRLLLKNWLRETVEQPIQSKNKVIENQPPDSSIQRQSCLPKTLQLRHGSKQSPTSTRLTDTTTELPCKTRKKRKVRLDSRFFRRHHDIALIRPKTEIKEGRKQTHKSSNLSGKSQSSESLKLNSKDMINYLQQFHDYNMLFRKDDQKKDAEKDVVVKKISATCVQKPVCGDSRSTAEDYLTNNLIFTCDVNADHYKPSRRIPSQLSETLNLKQLDSTKASRETLNQKKAHQKRREPLVHRENMVKGAVNPMQFPNSPTSHRSNSDSDPWVAKDIDSRHGMHNFELLSSVTNTGTNPTSIWMIDKTQRKQHDKGHDNRKLSTYIHEKVLAPLHKSSRSSHKLGEIWVESSSCCTTRESDSGSQSTETSNQSDGSRKPHPCRTSASESPNSLKSGSQHLQVSHKEKEICATQQHLTNQIVVSKLPSKTPFRMNEENYSLRRHKGKLLKEEKKTHSPHHQNLTKQAFLHKLPNQHFKALGSDKKTSHMMPCKENKVGDRRVQSDKQSKLHLIQNAKEKLRSKILKKEDNNMNTNESKLVGTFRKCKDKLALVFHQRHSHHHRGNFLRHLLHLEERDEVGGKLTDNNEPLHKKEHGRIYKRLAAFLRHILHPRRTRAEHKRLAKAKMMAGGRRPTKVHWWQKFYKKRGVRRANRKKSQLRISMGANLVRRAKIAAKH